MRKHSDKSQICNTMITLLFT